MTQALLFTLISAISYANERYLSISSIFSIAGFWDIQLDDFEDGSILIGHRRNATDDFFSLGNKSFSIKEKKLKSWRKKLKGQSYGLGSDFWAKMDSARATDWNAFVPQILPFPSDGGAMHLFAPRVPGSKQLIKVMVIANAKHGSSEITAAIAEFCAQTESPQVDVTSTVQGHDEEEGETGSLLSVSTTDYQDRRYSLSSLESAGEGSSLLASNPLANNWNAQGFSSSGIQDDEANPRQPGYVSMEGVTWNPSNFPGETGTSSSGFAPAHAESSIIDTSVMTGDRRGSTAGEIFQAGESVEPDIRDESSTPTSLVTLEDPEVLRLVT